ncbi:MAG: single-stranded DNA-binding protein [Desulfomicrobium escambiense]|nr:single-stranded DNA-binding protein [Desulfomicrobium escambiense]
MVGSLTRDAQLKYTTSGFPICTFGIAINTRRKNGRPVGRRSQLLRHRTLREERRIPEPVPHEGKDGRRGGRTAAGPVGAGRPDPQQGQDRRQQGATSWAEGTGTAPIEAAHPAQGRSRRARAARSKARPRTPARAGTNRRPRRPTISPDDIPF